MTTEAGRVITVEEARDIRRGLESWGKGGYFDWPVFMRQLLAKVEADAEKLAEYQGIVKRLEEDTHQWAVERGYLPPSVAAQVRALLEDEWFDVSTYTSDFKLTPQGKRAHAVNDALTAIRSAKAADLCPHAAVNLAKRFCDICTPGEPKSPRILTTEEIAEALVRGIDTENAVINLTAHLNRLETEVNKLKFRPVTHQQICELGHRGIWEAIEDHKGRLSDHHGRLQGLQLDVRNIAVACGNLAADVESLEERSDKCDGLWQAGMGGKPKEPAVPVSVLRRLLGQGQWLTLERVATELRQAIAAAEGGQ